MNHESTVQPAVTAEPAVQPAKGLAVASFLCGLASVVCCAIAAAVVGLILGGVAKKKGNTSPMRKAGVVCSIVGIVLSVVLTVLMFVLAPSVLPMLDPELFGDVTAPSVTEPPAHVTEPETTRELTVAEMLVYTSNGDGTYSVSVLNGALLPAEVVIPAHYKGSAVTAITPSGFMGQTRLREITLPDTLTSIGGAAFQGCRNLTAVELPDSVTYVGPMAFSQCTSLKEIRIPEGITEIPDGCFTGCSSLEKVTLPSTLTLISDLAFSECKQLFDIPLPDAVTYIGDNAFNGCKLFPHVTLPAEIKYIGLHSFFEADIDGFVYQGTMEDWENAVVKGESWCSPDPVILMICTDGTIELRDE